MSQEALAKELLIDSYKVSGERIHEALNGTFQVQNSRKPASPPKGTREVVGLCGQSGRHPYFRIPIHDLVRAVGRIRQLTGGPTEVMVETLAAICTDLRQRTFFDSGTGCVNDRLSAMVPLLPPEEIWYEDRELPLDVWRLISFEFDLVSSGISQQIDIPDFRFGAFNQDALAFRFLMKQLGRRRVRFEVRPQSFQQPWSMLLPASTTLEVSLARLFFESGTLLTPLAPEEFNKLYGALRYTHWIADRGKELQVRQALDRDSVDSRYKGLFSEEMAVGLMAIVLSDIFRAKPINNTAEVIPRGTIPSSQPIADFIAQARDPSSGNATTIIAESKGSLKTAVNRQRRDRAKQQVASTSLAFSGAAQRLGLAFASTIFFEGQSERTHCLVIDPPEEGERQARIVDPEDGWRAAYAKAFRFVGLETASRQVLRGEPVESLRPLDFDRKEERRRDDRDAVRWRRAGMAREFFRADLVLDVGESAVAIDSSVLHVLQDGIRGGVHRELEHMLDARPMPSLESPRRRSSFFSWLGLGMVFYDDLEQ